MVLLVRSFRDLIMRFKCKGILDFETELHFRHDGLSPRLNDVLLHFSRVIDTNVSLICIGTRESEKKSV
jgi:hypothetical protein